MNKALLLSLLTLCLATGCSESSSAGKKESSKSKKSSSSFKEGEDYTLFKRVRMLDRKGFTEPQEAYSILLPEDWEVDDEIIWNNPGSSCAGTFRQLKAASDKGDYSLEMLPDRIYMWNNHQELMEWNRNNSGGSSNCTMAEPMEAEDYLRNIFAEELGNPKIISVEENEEVVRQMQKFNNEISSEMSQYGGGGMQFRQTAINATVRWKDGMEGWVVLGSNIMEGSVPNVYDGTSNTIYTTSITNRTVFKYDPDNKEEAERQFSVIMSSIRTNPAWSDAVSKFWRQARQQSHTVHVGKIRMMDEQTRRIGEQAIRNGEERLRNMDVQMRNWEERQSSQDRMHTAFIKTIREVENYTDASGTYEMSAGYDHVWSRGDGERFILTNKSTFDPSSVYQDQEWKQMRKVKD